MYTERQKTLIRVYEMNNFLLQNFENIYRLRKIGVSCLQGKMRYVYAISLAKDYTNTLEDMTLLFYKLCNEMITENESLVTEEKAFRITSEDFQVFYYIEAWRKTADRIAYMENGEVKTELLHRMSCEQAAFIFNKHNIKPFEIINKSEVLKKYNSHADKFVALAKHPLLWNEDKNDVSER